MNVMLELIKALLMFKPARLSQSYIISVPAQLTHEMEIKNDKTIYHNTLSITHLVTM